MSKRMVLCSTLSQTLHFLEMFMHLGDQHPGDLRCRKEILPHCKYELESSLFPCAEGSTVQQPSLEICLVLSRYGRILNDHV